MKPGPEQHHTAGAWQLESTQGGSPEGSYPGRQAPFWGQVPSVHAPRP